jgi:uncharacterized damage-inducible protein DinB
MSIASDLLNELKLEAAVTRRFLAIVPFDKADFKPSEKSESLGRLAIHVAEIVAWWRSCIQDDELDFIGFEPRDIRSNEELLAYFDGLLKESEDALKNAQEEDFEKNWSMRNGEVVYFSLPKKQVARIFCMNHLIHHRAQLGVYLRMLGLDVPATYGPSADDEDVILVNPY